MAWTIEDTIKRFKFIARCDWNGLPINNEEYMQVAEWLEELVGLRKRLSDD